MKTKTVKINKQKFVNVVSKEHTVEIDLMYKNAVAIRVDGVYLLVQTNYMRIPSEITVYTPNVEITDFSTSEKKKIKTVPDKI